MLLVHRVQIISHRKQTLHRMRLRKFVSRRPLEDEYCLYEFEPDEDKVIQQVDLYTLGLKSGNGECPFVASIPEIFDFLQGPPYVVVL